MRTQLLVYRSENDPDYFVVTPAHLAHQAHADFYWSASDDRLTLVPRDQAPAVLARLGLDDAGITVDETGPFCYAA